MSIAVEALPKSNQFKLFRKIAKKFAQLCLSLFALLSICFVIMHIVPGDPFHEEQAVPQEVLDNLRHKYGLDRPILSQYASYLGRVLQGDLGTSMRYPSESVVKIIGNSFPVSIRLGLQALVLAVIFGISFGSWSAYRSNHGVDVAMTVGSTLGVSIPSFVIAATIQLLFSLYWPLFPVARWDSFSHTVLPSIALSVGPACAIMRIMRASMLDTLGKEWVMMARMKGVSECRVLLVHVIPNAILPVLHYMGPITANLLTGSFVIERVFCIPGLGQWFVLGVMSRDYPLIAGLTLFYSIILYLVHTVIDIITACFNKRLSQNESAR
jgi:ABC-type dipeptide/oligopeptide/nickel transport system permease component